MCDPPQQKVFDVITTFKVILKIPKVTNKAIKQLCLTCNFIPLRQIGTKPAIIACGMECVWLVFYQLLKTNKLKSKSMRRVSFKGDSDCAHGIYKTQVIRNFLFFIRLVSVI